MKHLRLLRQAASSATSTRNMLVACLWALYCPAKRSGTVTADALGIIAPNGSTVPYGTFSYWWYCIVG